MIRGPKFHVDRALRVAEGLLRTVGNADDLCSSFHEDPAKDAEIREGIRLYVETWFEGWGE